LSKSIEEFQDSGWFNSFEGFPSCCFVLQVSKGLDYRVTFFVNFISDVIVVSHLYNNILIFIVNVECLLMNWCVGYLSGLKVLLDI
jgi:hypothetical protein